MYIEINIAGLFFNPSMDEMDYLDFSTDHVQTTPFTGGPSRPLGAGILTTADITTAVVISQPQHLSIGGVCQQTDIYHITY